MDSTGWDQRYTDSELVWSAGPNQFLPPLVESMRPGDALDIACGEGRNAIWLAQQGWSVTGVDYSPVGIAKAQKLAGDTKVTWVVADVVSYEPGQTFDLVIILYLHLPPEDLESVMHMACRAVAPGGTLFAVGHALRNLTDGHGGPQLPEILWSEGIVAPMVSSLDVVELGERTRFLPDLTAPAIDLVVHAVKP
jgi:SAM-dependent methyltransferase